MRLFGFRKFRSSFPPFAAVVYEFAEEKVTGREGGKERYELQADKSVIQADSFDSGKRQNKERAGREESELKDGRKLQTVRADSARYDISL